MEIAFFVTVVFLGLLVLRAINRLLTELKQLRGHLVAVLDAHADQRAEIGVRLVDQVALLTQELEPVRVHLEEIQATTDLIARYKLPNKRDRESIDEIEIENEIRGK